MTIQRQTFDLNRQTLTNICNIKWGDTVLHDGVMKTVGKKDIKNSDFFGITLFNDSYSLGLKPVIKIG